MARSDYFEQNVDGSASVRTKIPRPIYLVIQKYASDADISEGAALRLLLREIAASFEEGKAIGLSALWERSLKSTLDINLASIADGTPPIDTTLLHRSDKLKSGYVGVYPNGQGWKAMGPNNKYLGQFPTAEAAAWKRLLFYQLNKIAYGELAVEIDLWRTRDGAQGSDYEIALKIMDYAKNVAGTAHIFQAEFDRLEASVKQAVDQ